MKKLLAILLAAFLLLTGACGSAPSSAETEEASEAPAEQTAEPENDAGEKLVGSWVRQEDGTQDMIVNEDGSGCLSTISLSTQDELNSNFSWSFENDTLTLELTDKTSEYRYTEDENGATLVNAADGTVFVNSSDWLEKAVVIRDNGESEVVRARDLLLAFGNNEIKFFNDYDDAFVSLVSCVTKIESDYTTTVKTPDEDLWYNNMTVLHLAGGWLVSLASDDPILLELSVGDPVSVDGYITGVSFMYGIAVLRANGHTTNVAKYSDEAKSAEDVIGRAQELMESHHMKDAYDLLNSFLSFESELTAEQTEAVQNAMDEIAARCYPNTFVESYDYFAFKAAEEGAEVGDGVYEYSTVTGQAVIEMMTQNYMTYLQNNGFDYEGDTYENVNGESEPYGTFTNDKGITIKMAIQYDFSFVRLIVKDGSTVTLTIVE